MDDKKLSSVTRIELIVWGFEFGDFALKNAVLAIVQTLSDFNRQLEGWGLEKN